MTYAQTHGLTKLEAALLVQEHSIKHSTETATVLGMVGGKSQVVDVWTHTDMTKGSVKGHGPITITPGVGDAGVQGVSGGCTVIDTLEFKETINKSSEWSYEWTNYPHGVAA